MRHPPAVPGAYGVLIPGGGEPCPKSQEKPWGDGEALFASGQKGVLEAGNG